MKYLTILFIFFFFQESYGCRCNPSSFDEEIESRENVFLAKVVSESYYDYELLVVKVWKGDLLIDNLYKIKQGNTSCNTRSFDVGEYYVFFESNGSISNCSLTKNYTDSPYYLKYLEEKFPDSSITSRYIDEINRIDYAKDYLVSTVEAEIIDIKDRNVIFFDGKYIIPKIDLMNQKWFLSSFNTNILLKDFEYKNDSKCQFEYEYVFYLHTIYDEKPINDKLRKKLTRKFIRLKCR